MRKLSSAARPVGASDTVRLLAVLLAGLLVSAGGAVWLRSSDQAGAEVKDNPMAVAVSVPPTTTTTVASAPPAPRPVAVPEDPYADEVVQEIGTIEIPKIGLRHKVMHGITLRNIDHGPSHWPGTALPGETGNSVFAGHRVTHSHPFRRIHELAAGDQVIFTVGGVRSVYAVTGHEVVTPAALHIADPTPTPTGTLFACHPPGSARYRYVVHMALLADG
jgi:sortase A